MKLKLIASVLVLMVALTGILGATAAYFSDTEQSTTTVAAGTLDLVLGRDGVTMPASIENMAPGDARKVLVVKLANTGTIDGFIQFKEMLINEIDSGKLGSKLQFDVKLYKNRLNVPTIGWTGIPDIDTSSLSSDEWETIYTFGGENVGGTWPSGNSIPALKANTYCYAIIEVKWTPGDNDNEAQGDSCTVNGVFELVQHNSQLIA